MEEKKILNKEFRNTLYCGLVEAGYDKVEAQRIVGVKYFESLHDTVTDMLHSSLNSISESKFSEASFDYNAFEGYLKELGTIHKFLSEANAEKAKKEG